MANFPSRANGDITRGESPSLYKPGYIDDQAKGDTEGGYELRRRRSTRDQRRTIETGFIGLSNADYVVLREFYKTHTTVVAFTYFDYVHDETIQVRFDEWKPDYKGVGQNRIWNVTIKMSEM